MSSRSIDSINASGSTFNGAVANDSNLSQADLTLSDLNNANFSDCNFSNANLQGASMLNAKIKNSDLTSANLGYANALNADFSNSNLTSSNLTNADLAGANFAGANLTGADFRTTNFNPDVMRAVFSATTARAIPTDPELTVKSMPGKMSRFSIAVTCVAWLALASQTKGQITVSYSQVGSSFQAADANGIGWASLGESLNPGEPPVSIRLAQRVQMGFPLTGWESEYGKTSWKFSPWFGTYEPTSAPWVYHSSLGWFLHQADLESIWLWKDELGWVWTNQDLFPYLYQNMPTAWLTLKPDSARPALLYDFPNKTWFELGVTPVQVAVEISPLESGRIDGLREVAKGENLALFARPEKGYVFSGWSGSLSSKDNPLFISQANSDLSLKATFVTVRDFLGSSEFDTALSGLSSDALREKATLELAFSGHSSLLSMGPGDAAFDPAQASLLQAIGENTQTQPSNHFAENSSTLTHPCAPWSEGSESSAYLDGATRGTVSIKATATEKVGGVSCLKLELVHPDGSVESRWLAEDLQKNVWLVRSSMPGRADSQPFVLLPAELKDGWKSWSLLSLVPDYYSIIAGYPKSVYAQGVGSFDDCVDALIYRDPHFQNEYYADKGLIKIHAP